MKYEIINTYIGSEQTINDDVYKVVISIYLRTTDGVIESFFKEIEVESQNSQTGYEVDEQRETAISDFLTNLNL